MPTTKEVAAVVTGLRLIETKIDAPRSPTTVTQYYVGNNGVSHSLGVTEGKEGFLLRYIDSEDDATNSHGVKFDSRDDENDDSDSDGDESESAYSMDLTEADTFDIDIIEEHSIPAPSTPEDTSEPDSSAENEGSDCAQQLGISISFLCPKMQPANNAAYTKLPIESPNYNSMTERCKETESTRENNDSNPEKRNSIIQNIVEDFTPQGDKKILRAICRTVTVNAAVLITAATGGAAGAVGYVAGGAITAKRLSDGIVQKDEKEVTKSLAVYGCATGASIAGQAITGALMIGVAGASLPLAGAVAFGVGCCSGVTAGALSEWTVDSVMDKMEEWKKGGMERCKSDGALLIW
eukprot:CAMPEP_0172319470 /NCGR_PEP_ID=MMETSP1058-20130122/37737_1 /TAXON_ID=83371 /ORGANISM="Detonula confervacea, Strain CCMP 353" /LENGTH=350 /DNA_ID=CAMNT_0013034519 /DNA_START=108 /DNA_END=1157 /DNA_ORIENTATION=-